MLPSRPQRPTIVFVPGAWHAPSAYDLLLPPLHKAKYPTTYVYLASVGATAPVTLEDDVSAIRKVVAGLVIELNREVVVVSHSYGATPTTEALRGLGKKDREGQKLSGGVVQLVYIAGIVPTNGVSCSEAFGPMKPKEEGGPWMEYNDLGDGFTSIKNAEECFYHDIAPEDAQYHASLLQRHYNPTGSSPLTYEAYKDIPAAFLYCEDDRAFPLESQERVVKAAGIQCTASLKTSHSPFLSDPEGVVSFIREVVEGPSRLCHIL
ncbi:Alpha/beta hydrolase fold-1 [Aspergillus cavernicola]|uniref:Alpha/beta hydrolase fold-1 n=1 Tax=Aspergillus cavernicola TaxID=176166 RepID=A0ABR4IDI0_9EURO